jgi:hypothetical protein
LPESRLQALRSQAEARPPCWPTHASFPRFSRLGPERSSARRSQCTRTLDIWRGSSPQLGHSAPAVGEGPSRQRHPSSGVERSQSDAWISGTAIAHWTRTSGRRRFGLAAVAGARMSVRRRIAVGLVRPTMLLLLGARRVSRSRRGSRWCFGRWSGVSRAF